MGPVLWWWTVECRTDMVSTDKPGGRFPDDALGQPGRSSTNGPRHYAVCERVWSQPIVHGRRAECGLLQCCRVGRPERSQSESDRPNGLREHLVQVHAPCE